MAGDSGGASETTLEYTPTWIVATVCSILVLISFLFERGLHRVGKVLKHKGQRPLFEALQKVKEELMLLGFISLLMTVFQGAITQKICVPESFYDHMLPCKKTANYGVGASETVNHLIVGVFGGGRRLLAGGGGGSDYCLNKGKIPLLTVEAIHQLHIFIFVLAVSHVVLSLLTVVLGIVQMSTWKKWEDSIQNEIPTTASNQIRPVSHSEFIQERYKGFGKGSFIVSWLQSFFKQFFGSVTKTDYTTLRLGFIMTHCKGNPKFNFYKYMIRTLEADFKKVVGISLYLWIFVIIFLLLNVNGYHTYFWISVIPLVLLLAVGTKLEHVIIQLAHEVAEKHTAIAGDLIVTPSDNLFWFHRPRIVLYLIHFILFQNAFEIAYFFWILTTYGYDSCIMDRAIYLIPRLIISIIIQLLCSYCTLPLYAIVTQMGSTFKKAIFEEHVQEGLVGWARQAKMRNVKTVANGQRVANDIESREGTSGIQLKNFTTLKVEIAEHDKPEITNESPVSAAPLLDPHQ